MEQINKTRTTIEPIDIKEKSDLMYLLKQTFSCQAFAFFFRFHDSGFESAFLKAIGVDIEKYNSTGFYYDSERNIHIATNSEGLTWISTMGLTSNNRFTGIRFLDSCTMQYRVLILIVNEALSLIKNNTVYDIESNSYESLCELTPALFHNLLFYFEVFGKSYLELNEQQIPHTHKLTTILALVKKQMKRLNHTDTIFHAQIIFQFELLAEYTTGISNIFKEEYVKYNDNVGDNTVIYFNEETLLDIKRSIELSYDFISCYYHDRDEKRYLEPGLLSRLINRAKNAEEAAAVRKTFSYLLE